MALLVSGCTSWELTGRNVKKDETPSGAASPGGESGTGGGTATALRRALPQTNPSPASLDHAWILTGVRVAVRCR